MIALGNLRPAAPGVVRKPRKLSHLMDTLCDEAALEMGAAFKGISGKRVDAAGVPGCGRHGVSRAINGSQTNPLYRIAGLFVLMKRLGMSRSRAQRIVDWLQELVDQIWGPEELPPLEEVLDTEQDLDCEDDSHQQRIGRIPGAAARMLEAKQRQHAHDRLVILALRQRVAFEMRGH
jgi:hypothetical protein